MIAYFEAATFVDSICIDNRSHRVSEVCWFSIFFKTLLLLQYRIPDAQRRGINITSIFGLVPRAFFFFTGPEISFALALLPQL